MAERKKVAVRYYVGGLPCGVSVPLPNGVIAQVPEGGKLEIPTEFESFIAGLDEQPANWSRDKGKVSSGSGD